MARLEGSRPYMEVLFMPRHSELEKLLAKECGFSLEEYPDFASEAIERIRTHVRSGKVLSGISVHGQKPCYIGRALRAARDRKGLTQAQVAVAAEWSVGKVGRMELGLHAPQWTDLLFLIGLYDVTLEEAAEWKRRRTEK